jgi:ABC-2 type transport system permease protein
MNAWIILVRREIWENRALWIAPLVAAGLVLTGLVLMMVSTTHVHVQRVEMGMMASEMRKSAAAVAGFMLLITSTVIGAYLLDCLYAERRDRSILFWKSLPVSDARTVISKFAVAMAVVPVGVFLASLVVHLLGALLISVFGGELSYLVSDWSFGGWFAEQANMAAALVSTLLWYAPLAAYLMLASVIARRTPMLFAVLPPLVLILAESLVTGTHVVSQFVLLRLSPAYDFGSRLAAPALWLGLVAAAALLLLVIRLRRYRDDT